MREEYSDRKLFFGMTLRPQNRPSPSSATSAMMWLLRSIDQSLSASDASSPCRVGIICEPGSLARWASTATLTRTRSGMNRNSPPTRVVNSRRASENSRTSATASMVGPTRAGRSSSRRRGRRANPSAASTADGGGAQRRSLRLEFLADVVDRVIALAQLHDLLDRRAFLGLGAGPWASDCKEIG